MLLPFQFYVFTRAFSAKNNQVQRPNILSQAFASRTSVADVICAGRKNILFALAVLLIMACATASAADVPKVQQEIDALMERNRTAMEQKDIDMYMSTYWPDAEKVIVRPNGEDIHICGMDAIRAQEKKSFEQSPIFRNFDEYRFSEPERAIVGSKATYIRDIEGRGLHLINQYDIVCRDGEWRIIRQVIEALPATD